MHSTPLIFALQQDLAPDVFPISNQSALFVGSSSAPQHTEVCLRRLNPRRLDVISDLKWVW